jgi:hypothetical protein
MYQKQENTVKKTGNGCKKDKKLLEKLEAECLLRYIHTKVISSSTLLDQDYKILIC